MTYRFIGFTIILLICTSSAMEMEDETHFTTQSQEADYNSTMFWGTYRPSVYLGMKTRSKKPFMFGTMWQSLGDLTKMQGPWYGSAASDLRETCEQGNNFARYGWLHHDGQNFGNQEIVDSPNNLVLKTKVLKQVQGKNGGHWTVRISGESLQPRGDQSASLFFYFGTEEEDYNLELVQKSQRKGITPDQLRIKGNTKELGDFSIFLKEGSSNASPKYNKDLSKIKSLADLSKVHFQGYMMSSNELWTVGQFVKDSLKKNVALSVKEVTKAQDKFLEKFKGSETKPKFEKTIVVPTLMNHVEEHGNMIVIQRVLKVPFELDVVFVSHSAFSAESNNAKTKAINEYLTHVTGENLTNSITSHQDTFKEKFDLAFNLKDQKLTNQQIQCASAAFSNLIGGMGYFWGSGIVQKGQEPPMYTQETGLFTAVPSRPFFPRGFLWDEGFHQLLVSSWNTDITIDVLKHWYNLMDSDGWIPREQILGEEARSKVPTEFQIQGSQYANPPTLLLSVAKLRKIMGNDPSQREKYLFFLSYIYPSLIKQYNWFLRTQSGVIPNTFRWRGRTTNHTFTSGLDDYPRLNPPSDNELHVDLLSWIAFFSSSLKEFSTDLGKDSKIYEDHYNNYVKTLNDIHWNDAEGTWCDVFYNESGSSFVVHKGYISLFPFLLGLVDKESIKLKETIKMLRDPKELWSNYGILSLSKSDAYFGTGEDYWKGAIWINVNYLILSSLHKNYINDGPYKADAKKLYDELRSNLIKNIVDNYVNTGYIWENYNALNGKGQRSHPFTGWSALVVLMMGEMY